MYRILCTTILFGIKRFFPSFFYKFLFFVIDNNDYDTILDTETGQFKDTDIVENKIKSASVYDLSKIVPLKVAEDIKTYLNTEDK